MKKPLAPKHPIEIIQHGHKRVDNYAWLRDENWKQFIDGDLNFKNPEVKKYIDEENDYTKEATKHLEKFQENMYAEILGRINEDDKTFPVPKGDYFYYTITVKGEDYPRHCRKKGSLDAAQEVYFDTNVEAKEHELYILKGRRINDANTYLAYAFNTSGSMEATIKIRNLETGKDFDYQVENSNGSYMWVSDTEVYYIERDEFSRGGKVYSFNIFDGPAKKKLIFTKPREYSNMFMSMGLTSDKEYAILNLASGASSAVYYHSIKSEVKDFKIFVTGDNDINYDLDHWDGNFYISTNKGNAQNFQIYKVEADHDKITDLRNWEVFIKESPSLYITDFDIYAGKIVIEANNTTTAIPELLIVDIKTKEEKKVQFQDEVYHLSLFGSYDHNSEVLRLYYQSPVQPSQDIDLNITTLEMKVLDTDIIPNYDPSLYKVRRDYAPSHDGELIPLTIITKKDFVEDGSAPAHVYAYGSYGLGMPVGFSSNFYPLVDRGFSYVVAHIRGGDEKGNDWYLKGKMHHKLNTFKDYISSCEHLIKTGYTSKGMIAANGGSAGGLLMGAVSNMRPDLFKCVIADVAFVDMINTISDETLPLTPPEWEEWGNPIKSKEDFEYMMSYSPYDNVTAQDYPHTLYNSGIADEQVTYWEPTKMVAKLRELKTDDNLLLLKMKMNAGHAGASKRYEWIEDKAFNYSFILNCFGMLK